MLEGDILDLIQMQHEGYEASRPHGMVWDSFRTLKDFSTYFNYLAKKHGEVFFIEQIGTSFEGM